jgi:hypothetical protein
VSRHTDRKLSFATTIFVVALGFWRGRVKVQVRRFRLPLHSSLQRLDLLVDQLGALKIEVADCNRVLHAEDLDMSRFSIGTFW